MGETAEVLQNRLKEHRARRNLTQEQLAGLVGVTRKTVNTVENGVFIPSTLLALRLARALETPVEELFFLNESPVETKWYAGAK